MAIHISPPETIIKEGDSLFLTCTTLESHARHNKGAPYVNFELPEMSYSLENQINLGFASSNNLAQTLYSKSTCTYLYMYTPIDAKKYHFEYIRTCMYKGQSVLHVHVCVHTCTPSAFECLKISLLGFS